MCMSILPYTTRKPKTVKSELAIFNRQRYSIQEKANAKRRTKSEWLQCFLWAYLIVGVSEFLGTFPAPPKLKNHDADTPTQLDFKFDFYTHNSWYRLISYDMVD